MNAETKIVLILVTLLAIGFGLIAYGLGVSTKLALLGQGLVMVFVAVSLLGAIWRRRL